MFLDLDFKFPALTTHGLFKSITQISASDPFFKVPLLILRIFDGFIVRHSTILLSGKDSLWYSSSARGRRVSTPIAPVAAWAKGSLLLSSSSGVWSETITSISPFFIPSISAFLSSSSRRGGDSFKNVLKSPISFSFKDKWLIYTPVVKFNFLFFHSLII